MHHSVRRGGEASGLTLRPDLSRREDRGLILGVLPLRGSHDQIRQRNRGSPDEDRSRDVSTDRDLIHLDDLPAPYWIEELHHFKLPRRRRRGKRSSPARHLWIVRRVGGEIIDDHDGDDLVVKLRCGGALLQVKASHQALLDVSSLDDARAGEVLSQEE